MTPTMLQSLVVGGMILRTRMSSSSVNTPMYTTHSLRTGGGDGGVLKHLLPQNPKHITVIDIDELVVKSAPTMLRGVCGSTLDSLEGDNYKVS